MSTEGKKKVLVVEDNPIFSKMLKARLISAGFDVLIEEDGLTGYNTALKADPDVILLDLMLPRMDGHKVCRLLKFSSKFQNVPVIILTSRDLEEDAELAKKNGADAFVVKTTRTDVLMGVINTLLSKAELKKNAV